MAVHDHATLVAALEAFSSVKEQFEAKHGPLPGGTASIRPATSA